MTISSCLLKNESRLVITHGENPPTKAGNPSPQRRGAEPVTRIEKKGKTAPLSIGIKGKVEKKKKKAKGRRAAAKKPRKRVTPEEEQDILTRFSRGETLRQVESKYRREIRGEIQNLRKAFEAEEFVSKGGVWQLVS